jgi:hypothetical protein
MDELFTPGLVEPLLAILGSAGFFFLAFQALQMLKK